MTEVALVQYDIAWEDPQANIDRIKALFDAYSGKPFDILILPETWPTGFSMNHHGPRVFQEGLTFMEELAKAYHCTVIGGLPTPVDQTQENRCYAISETWRDHYVKNRGFKFAGEHKAYRAGTESRTWQIADLRISPLICYDLRFPELARKVARESDALVYIANWPSAREHHWRSLLVARAIENQCYVMAVNRIGTDGNGLRYPGASMVVNPLGEILFDAGNRSGIFTLEILPETVKSVREKLPFLADM